MNSPKTRASLGRESGLLEKPNETTVAPIPRAVFQDTMTVGEVILHSDRINDAPASRGDGQGGKAQHAARLRILPDVPPKIRVRKPRIGWAKWGKLHRTRKETAHPLTPDPELPPLVGDGGNCRHRGAIGSLDDIIGMRTNFTRAPFVKDQVGRHGSAPTESDKAYDQPIMLILQ